MIEYEFPEHAYDMLKERNIQEAWVKLTMENPEKKELKDDGMIHYIGAIEEYGGAIFTGGSESRCHSREDHNSFL